MACSKMARVEVSRPKTGKSVEPNWTLDRFDLGRPLGAGAFGKVYLARTKKEKLIVALKVLVISKLVETEHEHIVAREIGINMHVQHPNIVCMYGWFWDDNNIYLIMEYAPNGMLYRLLQDKGHFNEPESATYISELADALIYLHGLKVIHRDIKPENLMVGGMGELKLGDFGWAVQTNSRRRTKCGTPDYLPPEMTYPLNKILYDATVDIWCTGVLLYEFLVGNPPFNPSNSVSSRMRAAEMESKIGKCEYTIPDFVSDAPAQLIRAMLKIEGKNRLPLEKLIEHPWITSNKLPRTEIDLFLLEKQARLEKKHSTLDSQRVPVST